MLAANAKGDLRISDALRYYYWALVLARSHPDNTSLRHHFGDDKDQSVILGLDDRINSIFRHLDVRLKGIRKCDRTSTKQFFLTITYQNQPVQDIDYTYWIGRGYSSLISTRDGIGVVTLEAAPEEGGSVFGGGEWEEGQLVTIRAIVNEGYEFVNWTDPDGAEISAAADYDYTMPAHDITLTANFEADDDDDDPDIIYGDGVTDIDGNEYLSVIVAGQEWMAGHLRTSRYSDGSDIVTGLDDGDWIVATEGAYAVYPHDMVDGIDSEAQMLEAYGKLYNWYAASDERNVCPEGWRVPVSDDYSDLMNYVIDNYDDVTGANFGNMLKSCRQVDSPLGGDCATDDHPRWDASGDHHGIDRFGFSAFAAGQRSSRMGDYSGIGGSMMVWTSTGEGQETTQYSIHAGSGFMAVGPTTPPVAGASIRCIKDE